MQNALAIPVLASVGTLDYESRDDFRLKHAWLTGPVGRRSLLWITLIAMALAAGTAGAYSYRENRRSANRIRCLSGLRQIGQAMLQYQYTTSLAADFGRKPAWQIERSRCVNELVSMIERTRLRRVITMAVPAGPMRGQVLEFWQDESRQVYYVRPPDGPGEGPLWQAGPFVSPP